MILVKKLTELQAQAIMGDEYKPLHYFSPVKDANGNWVISKECAETTVNEDFLWVKELPEIEFVQQNKTLAQALAQLQNQ